MSGNPLKIRRGDESDSPLVPSDQMERVRHWIDRGNRILWGQEPTSKGEWLTPRLNMEWVWRNGSYSIEERQPRRAQIADGQAAA